MKILKFILQKEFRQIFRNPTLLRSIFLLPVMQLIVLPWAANYEIKNISIAIVDQDHSSYSQQLISSIGASGYFIVETKTDSYDEALHLVELDKADILLQIPNGLEKDLVREKAQTVFIMANAINGTKAIVGSGYLGSIIRSFNEDVRAEWLPVPGSANAPPVVEITTANWFNRAMNYQVFMVPGILVMLVTMIGGMMSALNIVKEKEIGTIEQINVTPIKKYQFILGKLIPFWIIGFVVFSIGLLLAWLVYGIVPAGSLGVIYLFLSVYLITVLGLGLLISSYSETQQQAMSLVFFFLMIFNLLSGLFTPINSMPEWAQVIAYANPLTYFIDVMRLVVLKGSGLQDILFHLLVISCMAIGANVWAVISYRKTSG